MELKEPNEKVVRKCIRLNPDNYRDRKILEMLDSLPERQQGSFIKNAILATLNEAEMEITISQEQSIRAIIEDVLVEKGLLDMKGVKPGRSIPQAGGSTVRIRPETERTTPDTGSIRQPDDANRNKPSQPPMEFEDEEVNLLRGLSGFSLNL